MFYLKSPSKELSLISLIVSVKGKNFKYSTGENINPKHWDKTTHRAITIKVDETTKKKNKLVNSRLEKMATFYDRTLDSAKLHEIPLTHDYLYNAFEQEYKLKPRQKDVKPDTTRISDFYEMLDRFVTDSENGDRMTRNKTRISKGRIKQYRAFKNKILGFKKTIDVGEIDMNFYNTKDETEYARFENMVSLSNKRLTYNDLTF